jgi:hypothetical protein
MKHLIKIVSFLSEHLAFVLQTFGLSESTLIKQKTQKTGSRRE